MKLKEEGDGRSLSTQDLNLVEGEIVMLAEEEDEVGEVRD